MGGSKSLNKGLHANRQQHGKPSIMGDGWAFKGFQGLALAR
jgi:hypothetical protein